jgi:hypothetical protein
VNSRQKRSRFVHHELEVAQRWWSLLSGSPLPASNGATYTLLFAGLPGGAAGPDVRDAVFAVSYRPLLSAVQPSRLAVPHIVGDVEFHVHSAAWFAHGHHRDVRYNSVVLHVVFSFDSKHPTYREDGTEVPVCCLHDVALSGTWPLHPTTPEHEEWPCHTIMPQLDPVEVQHMLLRAGQLRFEQKIDAFVEEVHTRMGLLTDTSFSVYDQVLIVALAEGLGYGRDRLFFRALGLSLLQGQPGQTLTDMLPEPLGRSLQPAPLDARRLQSLGLLLDIWRQTGAWHPFSSLLLNAEQTETQRLQALQTVFCAVGISLVRADILIINGILPFAAAIGLIEHDQLLYEQALRCYLAHPGLSANRITRLMGQQLRLASLPQGSCQQQGLQYIYQQTCREKRCEHCILMQYPQGGW